MKQFTLIGALMLAAVCGFANASSPTVGSPLPLLSIDARGELTMDGKDFNFVPWRSDANVDKVHILQYFGASQKASETFSPFTDLLEKSLEPGSYHVSTILNLDAALWGTTGFVISELKKNKRRYPEATMVVDDKGVGVETWQLGKAGAGLAILDRTGTVRLFTTQAMSDAELAAALQLVREAVESE